MMIRKPFLSFLMPMGIVMTGTWAGNLVGNWANGQPAASLYLLFLPILGVPVIVLNLIRNRKERKLDRLRPLVAAAMVRLGDGPQPVSEIAKIAEVTMPDLMLTLDNMRGYAHPVGNGTYIVFEGMKIFREGESHV